MLPITYCYYHYFLLLLGTYKLQHDTGKNLKTVVVFPKVLVTKPASAEPSAVAFDKLSLGNEQQQSSSPEQICALSSQVVFTNMLQSKCPSWSQKKGCLIVLSEILERIQTYEHKLLKGEPLSDTEQEWYDAVSLENIAKKEALVKKEMAAHVEEGRITAREKDMLVVQVAERIEKLEADIAQASLENKVKKVETLTNQKSKADERKKTLEKISPQPPQPLKHEAEIKKLRQELLPLLKLEESCKGRLLTLKETTTLSRKDEILTEIQKLEVFYIHRMLVTLAVRPDLEAHLPFFFVLVPFFNSFVLEHRSPAVGGLKKMKRLQQEYKQVGRLLCRKQQIVRVAIKNKQIQQLEGQQRAAGPRHPSKRSQLLRLFVLLVVASPPRVVFSLQ